MSQVSCIKQTMLIPFGTPSCVISWPDESQLTTLVIALQLIYRCYSFFSNQFVFLGFLVVAYLIRFYLP